MKKKKLVLYDMQNEREPLYIEFKENVLINNEDQVVCEITIDQALAMLAHMYGSYFDEHIYIPSDVEKYLLDYTKDKEEKEKEEMIWKQVNATEEVVQEIIRERERKGKEIV